MKHLSHIQFRKPFLHPTSQRLTPPQINSVRKYANVTAYFGLACLITSPVNIE